MEGDRTYSKTSCVITDLNVLTVNCVCVGGDSLFPLQTMEYCYWGVRLSLEGDHWGDDDIEISRTKTVDNTHSHAHKVLYVHSNSC